MRGTEFNEFDDSISDSKLKIHDKLNRCFKICTGCR